MKAPFIGLAGFLALILAATFYVVWHLWRLTPSGWPVKLLIVSLFLLWMASFFLGFAFIEKVPVSAAIPLYEIGNTWLIAFMYLIIAFAALDLLSICKILPKGFLRDSWPVLGCVIGAVTIILAAGGIHYHHKYREEMTVTTSKALEKPLTVVLASDLHLGYHNRKAELGRWVDLFNAENPDLVLLGGDIVDRSVRPINEGNYAAEFKRLGAPVFAVLGNHEYFGDVEASEAFFNEAGITLLKDNYIDILGIRVVGRNDISYPCRPAIWEILDDRLSTDGDADSLRFAPYPGKCSSASPLSPADSQPSAPYPGKCSSASPLSPADSLTVPPQDNPFTILLDHQPYNLRDAEEAGIDFQFSGHTHRGQVWPISWVTDLMYEKSWGRHQRGSTEYYISSGIGAWGAKIRIGSRSEYMVLHILPNS